MTVGPVTPPPRAPGTAGGPVIRLVASDLDGTLVRPDGTVSARTRAALAAVERAGAALVLVTGRPPRWMRSVVEQTGHRGVAICANGAVVYDLHTERVLAVHPLDVPAAARFAARLRERLPEVRFAVECHDGSFGHEPGYRPRFPPVGAWVGDVDRLLSGRVVKLLARHEELDADALLATAVAARADLPLELTHSSQDGLLEVSGSGVTKASTLAGLAVERGIASEEVLAFGDMPNDVPMITWAGWGVAIGNAHPAALAAADEVAPDCERDGVARVLERVFPTG
jgi:hypothetical protein